VGLSGALRTAAVLALSASVIDCQLPGGIGASAPTPAQSAAAALRALQAARSVRMQGELTYADTHYTINLSMDSSSNVDGFVSPDRAAAVMVTGTAQRLLLKGAPHFLQVWSVVTGVRWVLAPDDPLNALVRTLMKRSEFVKALQDAIGTDVESETGREPEGTRTIKFSGRRSGVEVTIPAAGQPLPLRVVTPPAHALADGLSDVSLGLIEYGKPVATEMPDKYVDMGNRDTLPVHVVVDPAATFSWDACDSAGCTVSDGVRNDGGRDGTATATFTISRDSAATQVLTTCTVTIPVLANKQTTRIACHASYDTVGQHWGKMTITNPLA
jgi:hypothetical protein